MSIPEPETETGPEPTYVCPHCQTGTLRLRRVVFAGWRGGHFVTIPNFPGWVCDVCGEREYDAAALEQVHSILGAEQDLRHDSGRRARPEAPGPERPSRANGSRV
jgi:YgiT-type zinc finger domain-containing protein